MGSLEDKAKVGTVDDIVIDPDDGSVLGLIIKKNIFDMNQHAISWQDIREIDKNGVVVLSSEVILPIEEVVRIKELQKKDFNMIGLPVETRDGYRIGAVYDFEINPNSGTLAKIYTHRLLSNNRIISRSNIIEIKFDKIIIRADAIKKVLTEVEKVAEAETAI